jgi:dolichol-phosphate mannosyltransferase
VIELSVVIPVYGCADCLSTLLQRLHSVLTTLVPGFEIILVEDGGPDNAWEIITEIAKQNNQVKAFQLSRNFGQHAAITAGLAQSSGNWVVVMDCDLQDPPEEIANLYQQARTGCDVVLAKRKQKQQSWFRRHAARIYFKIINFFTQKNLEGEYGSFSIISRKVVNAYLQFSDVDRHYLFILHWLGFKTATIEYQHAKRWTGKSSYSLTKLIRHAFDGMFFQTTILLKWIVYLGFGVALSGVTLAMYYLYRYVAYGSAPGWTSLVVLILLIGGFIIISTGVTGVYIGKIFEQVKGRPLFVINKKIVDGVEE